MPETLLNKTGNGVLSQMLTQESKKCLFRLISRRPLSNVHACNVVDEPPEGARHHSTIFNKAFSLEKLFEKLSALGVQTGPGTAEYTSEC